MKTILKIIVLLFIAALVAGGFYMVVENTSSTAATDGRSFPPMDNSDGTRPERPEGMLERGGHDNEHGASFLGGLAGVIGALIKLTIVIAIALVVEKGINLLGKKRAASLA